MTDLGFGPNLDGYLDASLDLTRHVGSRTERMLAQNYYRLDGLTTPDQLRARQQETREAVLDGVGGLPEREPSPADVTWRSPGVTWRGRRDLGTHSVERFVFESLPGVLVTGNLYRPCPAQERPGPAVLFVCGHTGAGKADPLYQRVCARLAAAGITVLTIDPWGQGERFGYLDAHGTAVVPGGTAEHTYAGLQAWWLGQSTVRYFLHDALRAIDVLSGLPEVDPARIGVTGNSGGGMLCTLLMTLEPRLAAAAIGTYVTSRQAYLRTDKHQDAEQILLGGTRRGVDHADLLAAMAPRPVAVLAADFDFFPIEGTIDSVERAGHAYGLLGVPENLQLVRAPITHHYGDPLAAAAEAFFVSALGARGRATGTAGRTGQAVLAPEDLQCTRTGQVALDRPDARFLHDLLLHDLGELRDHGSRDPAEAAEWVRDEVCRDRRPPADAHPRWLPGPSSTLHGIWRSEEDVWGAGVLLRPRAEPGTAHRAVRLLLLGTGEARPLTEGALRCRADPSDVVLVLDVRGAGALMAHDKDGLPPEHHAGSTYKHLCDLLWLGDSLAAGRVFDVTRAIDILLHDEHLGREFPGLSPASPVHVYGGGNGGFLALLAAVVDDRITTVTVDDDAGIPERLLRERYYDDGSGAWQCVVPGLPLHAPVDVLRAHLGRRLVTPRQ